MRQSGLRFAPRPSKSEGLRKAAVDPREAPPGSCGGSLLGRAEFQTEFGPKALRESLDG